MDPYNNGMSAWNLQGSQQYPSTGMPNSGYGFGDTFQPGPAGFTQPGYGGQQPGGPGYGAQPMGGFGASPMGGFGAPPMGGFGAPPMEGYVAPPMGGFGAPPAGGYGGPPAGGYVAPPVSNFGVPPGGACSVPTVGASGVPAVGAYGVPTVGAYGAPAGSAYGAPAGSAYGASPGVGYSDQGWGAAQMGHPGAAGCSNPMSMSASHSDVFAPTLRPYPKFDASEDCKVLRKAMKGVGTDENALISVMGYRSFSQRVAIVKQFKTMFGKDLVKELKSELSGKFLKCMKALCFPPEEFDAYQLRKAMEGAGTRENALIEILCSRTNEQIAKIKAAYTIKFPGRNLEKDLASETSRHFKRLLVSLVQGNRDESHVVDPQKVARDSRELYEAGEKKLGTDESKFNEIIVSRSFSHLRAVFEEYRRNHKRDIETVLKSEMHGDLVEGFLAIVRCVQNKPAYFAKELRDAMKGAGTHDNTLVRIVISRCEIDMAAIKQAFQAQYNETLEQDIKGDTSGDYRKILLALIGGK